MIKRKFKDWKELLDVSITDEKSKTEVIEEMFAHALIPEAFKNYVRHTFNSKIDENIEGQNRATD